MQWQSWNDLPKVDSILQFKAVLRYNTGVTVYGLITCFSNGYVGVSEYDSPNDVYFDVNYLNNNLTHYLRIEENVNVR